MKFKASRWILLPSDRDRLAVSSCFQSQRYAKLTGCWQWLCVCCADMRMISTFWNKRISQNVELFFEKENS